MRRGVVRIGQQPAVSFGERLAQQVGRPLTNFELEQISDAERTAERQKQREDAERTKEIYLTVFVVLAAVATAPMTAAAIALLPAIMIPIATAMVSIFWAAVRAGAMQQDIAAAILTEGLKQGERAVTVLSNQKVLSKLGITIPKELSSAAKATYGLDVAQRLVHETFTKPMLGIVEDTITPGSAFYDVIGQAKGFALTEYVTPDQAFERFGVDPEGLAKRYAKGFLIDGQRVALSIREDVAAMALNASLNRYVYNIDWFNPVTGHFVKDPIELRRLREDAVAKGAPPEAIAVLDRRIARASPSEPRSESVRLYGELREARNRGATADVIGDLETRLRAASEKELTAHAMRQEEAWHDTQRECQASPGLAKCLGGPPTPYEEREARLRNMTVVEYRAFNRWLDAQPRDKVWAPTPEEEARPLVVFTNADRALHAYRSWQAIGGGQLGPDKFPPPGGSRRNDPLFEPGGILGAQASDLQTTPLRMLASGAVATAPLWVPVMLLPWLRGRGWMRA